MGRLNCEDSTNAVREFNTSDIRASNNHIYIHVIRIGYERFSSLRNLIILDIGLEVTADELPHCCKTTTILYTQRIKRTYTSWSLTLFSLCPAVIVSCVLRDVIERMKGATLSKVFLQIIFYVIIHIDFFLEQIYDITLSNVNDVCTSY